MASVPDCSASSCSSALILSASWRVNLKAHPGQARLNFCTKTRAARSRASTVAAPLVRNRGILAELAVGHRE